MLFAVTLHNNTICIDYSVSTDTSTADTNDKKDLETASVNK